MKRVIFEGSATALVTPFDGDRVDFEALGELIDFQTAHKTDALVVCGTTGEASTMPTDEHMRVIEYSAERTKAPLIAGCGSNDTRHACLMTELAEKAGADAVLSVTPYYNKANKSGLYEHFRAISESTSLPIILYNVPGRTGLSIDIETLERLAELENIVAIKEAGGDVSFAAEIAARVPEMSIYSGCDDIVVPMMSVGARGVISATANIFPEEMHDIATLYLSGETEKAKELQLYMHDVIKAFFSEVNPVPIKTAMNYLGLLGGDLRLPLGKMSDENFERLKTVLSKYVK